MEDDIISEEEDLLLFDPLETWKKTLLKAGSFSLRKMLVPIFEDGDCVYPSPDVMDIREYCFQELNTLWDESRRLVNPHPVYVDLSERLYQLKTELLGKIK